MQTSTLRTRAIRQALEFAWDSWAQLGVSAQAGVEDHRVADPEALLVFSFEVARHDARLLDEVLDWLRQNERLVSVQRLRNLCRDERDRQVVLVVLHWVSRFRRNPRFRGREAPSAGTAEALFGDNDGDGWETDPSFLEHGLVRGVAEPSFKSGRPDVLLPINFAFRLRLALSVTSRAEVVRYLLTVPAPDVPAQLVAQVTSYAKQNVAETLDGLVEAGLLRAFSIGNERRYSIDREPWSRLLGLQPDALPAHRDWPQLLWAVRRIVRFLDDPELDGRSLYLRASAAHDLIEEIEPSVRFAGVHVGRSLPGERYWDSFAETVDASLEGLRR